MCSYIKYEKIYQQLREKILSGEMANGILLPKEIEYATQIGVGRVTLRSALSRLEEDGLVRRVPGKGTFVTHSVNGTKEVVSGWKERAVGKKILVMYCDDAVDSSCQVVQYGVESRCKELGVIMDCFDFRLIRASQFEHVLEQLRRRNYCGVILEAAHFLGNEPVIHLLKQMNLPTVMPFAHDCDSVTTPFTLFDVPVRRAVFLQLHYLAQHGHSIIAFIGAEGADFINCVSPYEYRSHTSMTARLFLRAKCTPEDVGNAMDEMLTFDPRPTALICINSYYAMLALEALAKRGIKVPKDMSVIGYGDMPGCELLNPPLTYVSPLLRERGVAAVDFLLGGMSYPPVLGVRLEEHGSVLPRA